MISTVISVVALGFSLFVLVDNRRRDRRDLLLKLHEELVSEERQRGRRLIYQLADQPVESWESDQYDRVNNALAFFDVFGMYVDQRYVRKDDALRLWAEPVYLAWQAAQPFLEFRARQVGYRAWPYFERFARDAEADLRRRGSPLVDPGGV
jgi:hypothetical protein